MHGGGACQVIVDDRLPLGKNGKLLCACTSNRSEMWVRSVSALTWKPFTRNPLTCNSFTCNPLTCSPLTCKPFTFNPFTRKPLTCKPFACNPFTCNPFTCNLCTCNPFTCNPCVRFNAPSGCLCWFACRCCCKHTELVTSTEYVHCTCTCM